MEAFRNSNGEQQLAGSRLGRVPVEGRELALDLGRVQAFGLAQGGLRVQPLALLIELPQPLVTHDDRVKNGGLLERELILAQLADAHVRLGRDVAVRRLELAGEDLQERRLAGAVRADQPVTIPVAELDGDVLEERLLTELNSDVGG